MLKGISGSAGYGIGNVFLYRAFEPAGEERYVSAKERPDQNRKLELAFAGAREELLSLSASLPPAQTAIFTAHLEILADEAIREDLDAALQEDCEAEWAVFSVFQTYIQLMQNQHDERMRERAADLQDVRNRIIRIMRGEEERSLAGMKEAAVVAAKDILPSDVARIDRTRVLAFLTEMGGATSHAAILARSLGIPAVLGVSGLLQALTDVHTVIVDGTEGIVLTDPPEDTKAEYRKRQAAFERDKALDIACLPLPAITSDGTTLSISMNIGSPELPENESYLDGVGLFRSEFLYMERASFPSEETQCTAYESVLRRMKDRPVILRTLDIGGDKSLPYMPMPKEENPFLGNRAIRLCLEHTEIFRTQLRAAYRAAGAGNLWIMFPMIGSLEDFRRAKAIALSVRQELLDEGVSVPEVPLGIMIEIPSAAVCADQFAEEADFASIGTNDLCQYTFAADRMNPAVAQYAHPLSSSMLRLVRMCAQAFNAAGKPLSVCGELASEATAIPLLIGCGVRKLSMSTSAAGKAKRVVRACSARACESLAAEAMRLSESSAVTALAEQYLCAVNQV